MILYPSGDSQTNFRYQAWGIIGLCLLSLAAWLVLFLPAKTTYSNSRTTAMLRFFDTLEKDFGEGLNNTYYEQAQRDPATVINPEFDSIYSDSLKSAYRDYLNVPLPMIVLEREIGFKRILLAFVPHHLGLMFVGFFCLIALGFLFEHLYDRPLAILYFIFASLAWFLFNNYIPEMYRPSTIFAWSFTVATLSIVMWVASPRATIFLTFRTWLVRSIDVKWEIPAAFFTILYLVAFLAALFLDNTYASQFSPTSLAVIPVLATLLVIPLSFVPTKKPANIDYDQLAINQQIAVAENLFLEEKTDEALELLRTLLTRQPEMDQVERIADLAWRYHDNQLAQKAYMTYFREAFNSRDFHKVLNVTETLLHRNIPIPANALVSILRMAVRNNQLSTVRQLLKHMFANKAIPESTVREILDGYAERLVQQANPDRLHMNELLDYLSKNLSDSRAYSLLDAYIHRSIEDTAPKDTFGFSGNIHKYVDIELHGINDERVFLQVTGGKEQRAPWTAIMAVFCCYQTGSNRGYRGCILLRFQRKVFACSFTPETIHITTSDERRLTFEETWQSFAETVPEGLPISDLHDIKETDSEETFKEALMAFMKEHNL